MKNNFSAKMISRRIISLILVTAILISSLVITTFITAQGANLNAYDFVSTTRKTYSFNNMEGVVTNSGAVIENGAMTFTVAEGNKFVFDFPLRNGKSYGISMVFSIDGTTDQLDYFYSGPKVIGSSAFDATAAVNGVEFTHKRANDAQLFKGDKMHTQFLFSIPEGTITDNNSKYTSIELCRDATRAAMGKKMYLDSVTIFEVGAYAEFNFNDDSEFFWHYYDELDTANGEHSTSKTGSQARFALSYILEADKTYTYAYRQKAVPTTATAVSKYTFAILSSAANSYHTNKSIVSTYPTPKNDYENINGSFTTTSTNVTSDSNALYINPKDIQGGYMVYDYIRVGRSGGTVKFVGVEADPVTGYYGQSVALPTADGTAVKWYLDKNLTVPVDGITIPEKGETVTLYAEGSNISAVYDFSADSHIAYGTDGTDIVNGEVKMVTLDEKTQSIRLPYELKEGKNYSVSLKYRAEFNTPEDGARLETDIVYAGAIDSSKQTGEYMFAQGETVAPESANMQMIDGFTVTADKLSGTYEFSFTANSPFKTLYSDAENLSAYIMKYIGIRTVADGCVDATLYIDEVAITECGGTVEFVTNGGSAIEPIKNLGVGEQFSELPVPTRAGYYVFEGWCSDEALNNIVTEITVPNYGETLTLYAKWTYNDPAAEIYDFSASSHLNYGFSAEIANEELKMTANSGGQTRARLPYEFKTGTNYTVSFDYRVVFDNPVATNTINISVLYGSERTSWTFLGESMYSSENTSSMGNYMQPFGSLKASTANPSGKYTVTFTAPEEFKTLYSYNSNTQAFTAHIMKWLSFRAQPSGSKATLYIDNVSVTECGGAIKFDTGCDVQVEDMINRSAGVSVDVSELPVPVRIDGYNFEGWYTDSALTQKVTTVVFPNKGDSITLYANWIEGDPVPIIYDFSDSAHVNFSTTKSEIINEELSMTANKGQQERARLPFEFKKGKSYTVSFKYNVVFDNPTASAKMDLGLAYANELNSWKLAGEYMYSDNDGADTDVAIKNIKYFKTFKFIPETSSGTLTFSFTTPEEFATLYNDVAHTKAYVQKYFSFRIQPDGCTSATITIDDVSIVQVAGAIEFVTNAPATMENYYAAKAGTVVDLSTLDIPVNFGKDFAGWYYDAALTKPATSVVAPASGDSITLYAKWVRSANTTAIIDFSDSAHLDYGGDKTKIKDEKLVMSALKGQQERARLPYEFVAGQSYSITLDYKVEFVEPSGSSSVETRFLYSTNLLNNWKFCGEYLYAEGNDLNATAPDIKNMKTFHTKSFTEKAPEGTYTFAFTAPEEFTTLKYKSGQQVIDCIMKYFGIRIQTYNCKDATITFDNIVIEQVAMVHYKGTYQGLDLDLDSEVAPTGKVYTLKTTAIKPLTVIGWYYDEALTQPVGKTITAGSQDITVYGKFGKVNKVTFDFNNLDEYTIMDNNNQVTLDLVKDEKNPNNNILEFRQINKFAAAWFKADYLWLPNRKYKMTLRIRAVEDDFSTQLSIRCADNRAIWSSAGKEPFENTFTWALYNDGPKLAEGWKEITAEFSSDEPPITNVYKYLYMQFRGADTKGALQLDEFTIEDLGAYNPSDFVTKIDSYTWEKTKENLDNYSDWKLWIAKSGNDETKVDNVTSSESFPWLPIIIAVSAVLLGGTTVLVILLLKRRKKK